MVKLKSLYIEKYKNLSPLTIDFESGNGLTMLVGNNGSGKSNVLEAISGIFHDLFKEKDGRKITCNYKLKYTLNEVNCIIEQTNGFLRCYAPKFKRREYFIEENAPNNIIGLYSGEEDRLWTSFYESYYPNSSKHIFCCTECKEKAKAERIAKRRFEEKGNHLFKQRNCILCGTPFWPSNGQERLCSPECKAQNRREKQLAYYHRKKENSKQED